MIFRPRTDELKPRANVRTKSWNRSHGAGSRCGDERARKRERKEEREREGKVGQQLMRLKRAIEVKRPELINRKSVVDVVSAKEQKEKREKRKEEEKEKEERSTRKER